MPADPDRPATRDAGPGVERLLALSDGVVAIAITLLVLQLNVPEPANLTNPASASELASALGKDADQLISYVISFYVIAQFWLVHHRVFRRITRHREGLAWWNFAFLFTISVMPFTSDLQGRFAGNPLSVDIFAANLLAAALATQLTVIYASRKNLVTAESRRETRAAQLRAAGAIFVIALSIGVAWVNTGAARYCWLLLAVVPRMADWWSSRRPTQLVTWWWLRGSLAVDGRSPRRRMRPGTGPRWPTGRGAGQRTGRALR
jgi:uncharacterized membrane protein